MLVKIVAQGGTTASFAGKAAVPNTTDGIIPKL
jgi:hypothetical protein